MTRRWWLLGTACAALITPTALMTPVHAGNSDTGTSTAEPPSKSGGPDLASSTSEADRAEWSDPWLDRSDPLAASEREPRSRLRTHHQQRPVAPGVTLESFDAYGPDPHTGTANWLRGDSLTVDLTSDTTVDYLFPGQIAEGAAVSDMAQDAGAVAAVNGDFFDIDRSNAPLGVGVRDGEPVQSPDATDDQWHSSVAMITPDGLGDIGNVFFSGTVDLPGNAEYNLDGLNKPYAAEDQVHAYTPAWGSHCRCTATEEAVQVTEVEVVANTVTAVRESATDAPIPSNGFVLVGREAGAKVLAELKKGESIGIDYRIRGPEQTKLHAAINGRQPLVVDGKPVRSSDDDNATHPRTAVGFSEDGSEMFLLTVDGRQPAFATGVGLDELADMMVELGAYNAINLDGGGSTTIAAREPGSEQVPVQNSPSDGEQRPDPNGLGLFAPKGSGKLQNIWVQTALDPRQAAGAQDIAPARTERVFPGFTRVLSADGYDETFGPAEATPRWRTGKPKVGNVDSDSVFHARRTGETTAVAVDGEAHGTFDLTVLDELDQLRASTDQVALAAAEDSTSFSILGYDEHGQAAPFEPGELSLSYDQNLVDIDPTQHGTFRATAKGDEGTVMLKVSAGDVQTLLPITIGFDEVAVADFEDVSEWEYFGEGAEGAIEPAEGRTGNGLRLTYDFTASTDTRTGGVIPRGTLAIPGEPRALGLWVKSSGNGEWPSLQVRDASGTLVPAMRDEHLTESGWQRLEFTVPEDVSYPLTFERYYSAEVGVDRQYQGELVLDDMTALVPPEVEQPARTDSDHRTDRSDAPASERESDWSFAVVSDAGLSAPATSADGQTTGDASDAARQVRKTLRDVRNAGADLVLVNGDLVAEGNTDNLRYAERLLHDELGDEVPYVYVPGERERGENGELDAFEEVFDDPSGVFDHRGTRFITLDTSQGSLRQSDWSQVPRLRKQLDRAASDHKVRSVVVVSHRPMFDPDPFGTDGLVDRKEASTLAEWLADFRRDTGKGTALVGAHAGQFGSDPIEGVPSFANGPAVPAQASMGPATSAATSAQATVQHGWTMLLADQVGIREAAQVRHHPWRGGPDWLDSKVRTPPERSNPGR